MQDQEKSDGVTVEGLPLADKLANEERKPCKRCYTIGDDILVCRVNIINNKIALVMLLINVFSRAAMLCSIAVITAGEQVPRFTK